MLLLDGDTEVNTGPQVLNTFHGTLVIVKDYVTKCTELASKGTNVPFVLISSNIDFMGLSETWLSPSCPEAVITMPGYNIFREDRLVGKGGGLLLYVKNCLNCHELELPTEIQLNVLALTLYFLQTRPLP